MASPPPDAAQDFISRIAAQFALDGAFVAGEEIESGHINSTYRVSFETPVGQRRYVLQRINEQVFKDPAAVMRNVVKVTDHLRRKVPPGARALRLFPSREGELWVAGPDGGVWRCYNHIEGCVTHDVIANARQAYQAARAFGGFQRDLGDLPASELVETIPDFHHTRKRFDRLMDVAASDSCGRVAAVAEELEFVRRREADVDVITDLLDQGVIPRRITHNDTKINNVMMDAVTDEAACVIDLDTVMPGSSLYDFGDLVRTATSPAAEDERDLAKITLQLPMFEALAKGFLDAAGEVLSAAEKDHLAFSGKLITLETGIRFLTDFLDGDRYFKTHRPGHNLDRCRTQFRLVAEIERELREMEEIVRR